MYLSEAEASYVATLASREGISQADVIRNAIRQYVPTPRAGRDFALSGCAEGPGGSVADIDEDKLLEGFGS